MQARLKEIEEEMEFHVALLGGPGSGKTSFLKLFKNYTEDNEDCNESVASISQEMMKHTM